MTDTQSLREQFGPRDSMDYDVVVDPIAISELFPDWQERGAPLNQPVSQERCCS
ncbi:MAG: hypothetical protein ABI606_07205 [Rhodoferax sp.]